MSSRMSQQVVRRPNLPLTARDEEDLARLRSSSELRAVLERLAPSEPGLAGDVSEAVLLHAVLEAGFAAVRAGVESDGYAQLAAEHEADGDRRRMSRRRTPAWASGQ